MASPLFALSVAPYAVFLKRVNDAPSATVEMRQAFATPAAVRADLDTGGGVHEERVRGGAE